MKKQETVNTFSDGLIMDLNPLSMPNTALSDCLNGTVLTYNGNENMLQNDMGNARVETAMLPSGYIPVGSTSFGGIIYILSYNPLEQKCQVGSFPSPERNLSKDETGDNSGCKIDLNKFTKDGWKDFKTQDNIITNYFQKVELTNKSVYAGDKYKIFSNNINDISEYISGWDEQNTSYDSNLYPKYLKFEIQSSKDDGKLVDITKHSIWTGSSNPFYIYNENIIDDNTQKINLDEYRGLVGSNYDVYQEKSSGNLQLVAKLEVPTSFSVGYTSTVSSDSKIQLYLLLNWTNDNIGIHKNRVNPSGINVKIKNIKPSIKYSIKDSDIKSDISVYDLNNSQQCLGQDLNGFYNINFTYPIELQKYNKKELYKPDTYDNIDYCTTVLNETNGVQLENIFDDNKLRKNDGTDYQYIIKLFDIKQEGDNWIIIKDNKSYVLCNSTDDKIDYLNLNITPIMPFGQLDFLKKDLHLKLSALGTDLISFSNYQYYVESDKINIDFAAEIYTAENTTIEGLDIVLQPLVDIYNTYDQVLLQSFYENELNQYYDENETQDYYKLISNDSKNNPNRIYLEDQIVGIPSGLQHIEIPKSELKSDNQIYLINFVFKRKINKEDSYVVFNRLLFNSTIFNNAYGQINDFKDIYLYDENQNYGLSLDLSLDAEQDKTFASELVDSDTNNISDTVMSKETNLQCKVSNKYESKPLEFDSGIKEIKINATIKPYSDEVIVDTECSEQNISTETEQYPINLTSNQYVFSFTDNFDVQTPITLEYNKVHTFDVYKYTTLITNLNLLHRLEHYSKEENEGNFKLWHNYTNKRDDMYIEDIVAGEIPDKNQNITVFLTSIMEYLLNILNKYKLDYLNVIFGIKKMGDNNCGYGIISYNASNDKTTSNFYKLVAQPEYNFISMTCLRSNVNEAILLHKDLLEIDPLKIKYIDMQGFDKDSPVSYYEKYSKTFISDKNPNYYRYVKTSDKKQKYTIGDINIPNDAIIKKTYTINVHVSSLKVLFNEEDLGQKILVKNLIANVSESIKRNKVTIVVNYKIDNQSWYLDFNTVSLENKIYAIGNGVERLKPESVIYKVYTNSSIDTTNTSSILEINEDGYVQVNSSSQYISTAVWFFGWENTFEKNDTPRTESGFKESSKQYYKLFQTYDTSST